MNWVPLAIIAIVAFGVWGAVSKRALGEATWAQTSLIFGVAVVVLSLIALLRTADPWTTKGVTLAAIAGVAGAVGFVAWYLALERGPASQVVPVIGIYPALTAILAVLFLADRLGVTQVAGIALAILGVLLVGRGG